MKILVTGGAGFLGSFLCESLLRLEHQVICLDNFYTGNVQNINHLNSFENFQVINHDVTEKISLEVDGIFNLACPASPIQYQKNPVFTIRTNVLGTLNMLDLATQTGARFLQASTSEIYGDPEISPQSENYWGNVNPIGVRACYDEGKRVSETLATDYHRQFNTDIRIARIFNTFGPRMDVNDGRVISNFIVQALKNEDLTVYGDGLQTRSFCYVTDLIEGLIALFLSSSLNEPINLGKPEPITMKTLAENIIKITKSNSKIIYLSMPEDDPKLREPDITKATKLLNWAPKVSTEQGLNQTIDYFKTVLATEGQP
jgi:UDP-glucuronate decarboxylase